MVVELSNTRARAQAARQSAIGRRTVNLTLTLSALAAVIMGCQGSDSTTDEGNAISDQILQNQNMRNDESQRKAKIVGENLLNDARIQAEKEVEKEHAPARVRGAVK